jgi:hypothetical protein
VLECAGHARDLGRSGTGRLGGGAPCRRYRRDLFDDRAGLERRLERLFAYPAESESTQAGLVGDAEQVIAFRNGAN